MGAIEDKIVYENGDFYAFQISSGKIEIRKNTGVAAVALGIVPSVERAKRFIDRAAKYPNNF